MSTLPIVGNTNLLSPFAGNNRISGQPTIPGLARSQMTNTNIDKSNNSLSHNCGISQELIKNLGLKEFINSQAQTVRDAVNAVIKALGFDPTGQASSLISILKDITAEIKYFTKKILKPIQDFQKYVIKYTQYLNATIAWILSLPAKLLALFKDCLSRLYQLLSGIFSDVFGGNSGGLKDTLDAAKEVAQTTINSATAITSAVVNLPTNIAAAISAPPSAESVAAAGEAITGYFDSLPSAEEANAGNQKSKSP
jgi:phage-related protein